MIPAQRSNQNSPIGEARYIERGEKDKAEVHRGNKSLINNPNSVNQKSTGDSNGSLNSNHQGGGGGTGGNATRDPTRDIELTRAGLQQPSPRGRKKGSESELANGENKGVNINNINNNNQNKSPYLDSKKQQLEGDGTNDSNNTRKSQKDIGAIIENKCSITNPVDCYSNSDSPDQITNKPADINVNNQPTGDEKPHHDGYRNRDNNTTSGPGTKHITTQLPPTTEQNCAPSSYDSYDEKSAITNQLDQQNLSPGSPTSSPSGNEITNDSNADSIVKSQSILAQPNYPDNQVTGCEALKNNTKSSQDKSSTEDTQAAEIQPAENSNNEASTPEINYPVVQNNLSFDRAETPDFRSQSVTPRPGSRAESIRLLSRLSSVRLGGNDHFASTPPGYRRLLPHLFADITVESLFNKAEMRRINFVDESDNFEKLADFLVAPEGTSSATICDKFFKEWKLETPKLIISVSGWSNNMPIVPPRQLLRLKQGLLRTVQSTNTWILSTGITHGVDGLIAEVLQDAQYLEWIGQQEPKLHLIGMVNWNLIRHGDEVQFWTGAPRKENSETEDAFHYNVNSGLDESATLNKLFSHFVFFDSHSPTKDAEMRSALECFLSSNRDPVVETATPESGEEPNITASTTAANTIPTVLIVMGGELPIFEQVAKSLVNHIAVVICEGVGGASEIIAKALRLVRKSRNPLTINQETNIQILINNLAKKLGVELDEVHKTELQFIKIILEYSRYVIIYRIDRPNNHMDECILKALIRSVSDLGCDALQLAMNLHQCDDVVQSIVEAESDINERKNIGATCFRALIEGQLPFVKLFLEVGFEMKRFLTPNRLSLLYQDTIEKSTPLLKLLTRTVGPKDSYSLSDVYFMVYYYTLAFPENRLVDLPESGGQKGFEDPFRELCFWSLFSLKPELAHFFWSKAKDPLIIALMCAKLWQEMYNCLTIGEMELKEEVEPLVEQYRNLALSCLEEYQGTNGDLSAFLLTYKNPKFGSIDLIDVAGFTDNKDFIATTESQICIEHKWKKGMRCSFKGIIFSVFFPCSIPSIYSEKVVTDFDVDSNDNGLSLEEEILLLEQQNQQMNNLMNQARLQSIAECNSEQHHELYTPTTKVAGDEMGAKSSGAQRKDSNSFISSEEDHTANIPPPPPPYVAVIDPSQTGGNSHKATIQSKIDDMQIEQLDDNTGVLLKQTTYSQFYNAPATKFFLHISMYFIFLVIYTYFYCYENSPGLMNKWKITIFVYMVSYVIEIAWHFCQGSIGLKVKLVIWCSSEWNLLDVTYLSMGIVAFFCSVTEGWPMTIARALYGVTSILMWIRLLRFYLASEKLGSMWIMIRRMLWETMIFMTHMGIMIIASGISLYCINNKDPEDFFHMDTSDPSLSEEEVNRINVCQSKYRQLMLYREAEWLFLQPYFMFNGELFLIPLKCGEHGTIAWIMAALFLLLGNALMLNLLVAIYAAIFNDVQKNSEREWKMEMYWLLKDFEAKTILPPPLSLVETVIQIVRILYSRRCKKKKSRSEEQLKNQDMVQENGSDNNLDDNVSEGDDGTGVPLRTIERLQIFESYCVGKALRKIGLQRSCYESVADMIQDTETQLGKVQDCRTMVNNVRRMIQTQKSRRKERRRQHNLNNETTKPNE